MVAVAQSGQWAVQLTPGQSSRRFGLSDPTDVGSRAELDGQSGLARRAVGRGFPTDGRTVASRQRTVELVSRKSAPVCPPGQPRLPIELGPTAHVSRVRQPESAARLSRCQLDCPYMDCPLTTYMPDVLGLHHARAELAYGTVWMR